MHTWRTGLALLAATTFTLSACAPTVRLQAAPEANAVACANMMVRMPETIGQLERRSVDAQATAAYGTPTAVIVRCGLPQPGPSTLPCATVDGVDWLIDDSDDPTYVFTSYGLDPATEVVVDSELVSGTEILQELAGPVSSQSAPNARCIGAEDVFSD